MKLLAILHTAFASLGRHKLRSILSASGVAAGVMALVSMLAVTEGAARESDAALAALGADNLILRGPLRADSAAGRRRLTGADGRQMAAALPDARDAGALRALELDVADSPSAEVPAVLAVEAGWLRAKQVNVAAGRTLSDLDDRRAHRVCVLGNRLATALESKGAVGERIRVGNTLLEVVGVLRERGGAGASGSALAARDIDGSLFLPLSLAPSLDRRSARLRPGWIPVDEWSMRVAATSQLSASAKLARRVLERLHGDLGGTEVVLPEELLAEAQRARRTFGLVLAAIACIALGVGGVGILNILLSSVSERTREIGIRRSVGATRGDIMLQFLAEALGLSAGGASLGLLAGVWCAHELGQLAGWPVVIAPWSAALALAMALGVGLLAGALPAMRAARVDPIIALRHP